MRRRGMICFSLLAAVLCLTLIFQSFLDALAVAGNLSAGTVESEAFRKQEITLEAFAKAEEAAAELEEEVWEVLAVFLIVNRFSLDDAGRVRPEHYRRYRTVLERWKPEALEAVTDALRAVWSDVRAMPVGNLENKVLDVAYEDGWMDARGDQGERRHEGTDLFCRESGRETPAEGGIYPVVSMTDGYVENIGWLNLGGWRIGVRSPSGGYFYYAHLSDYARDFQPGEQIRAGELLGFMGDTGYGPEGTQGLFPVHLHLGIYFTSEEGKEISVNPYPLLRILDNA